MTDDGADLEDDGDVATSLERATRALERCRPAGDVDAHARRIAVLLSGSVGFATSFGLAAVVGFGLLTAAASGAEWVERLLILLLPAVTVAYLVLLDGATVGRPTWPDWHPPLADAWLVVAVGYGAFALGLEAYADPWLADAAPAGWPTLVLAVFVAGPPWFARRCLRPPSWTVAVLGVVVAPMAPLFGLLVRRMLGLPFDATDAPMLSAAVAAVAAVVPFTVAALAPDPETVALGLVARSRRARGTVVGALGSLLGDG